MKAYPKGFKNYMVHIKGEYFRTCEYKTLFVSAKGEYEEVRLRDYDLRPSDMYEWQEPIPCTIHPIINEKFDKLEEIGKKNEAIVEEIKMLKQKMQENKEKMITIANDISVDYKNIYNAYTEEEFKNKIKKVFADSFYESIICVYGDVVNMSFFYPVKKAYYPRSGDLHGLIYEGYMSTNVDTNLLDKMKDELYSIYPVGKRIRNTINNSNFQTKKIDWRVELDSREAALGLSIIIEYKLSDDEVLNDELFDKLITPLTK